MRNVYNVFCCWVEMEDCVFCKIVAGEVPSDKVFENDEFVVIRDIAPKVEGHILVIPKKHFSNFVEMDSDLDRKMLGVVREVVKKEGVEDFNLVLNNGRVAGQLVDHVHLHVLPRIERDGFEVGV